MVGLLTPITFNPLYPGSPALGYLCSVAFPSLEHVNTKDSFAILILVPAVKPWEPIVRSNWPVPALYEAPLTLYLTSGDDPTLIVRVFSVVEAIETAVLAIGSVLLGYVCLVLWSSISQVNVNALSGILIDTPDFNPWFGLVNTKVPFAGL